jgi:hypothetical protein
MDYNSVKVFLETMCQYNTTNIRQVFTTKDGHSLSIRCLTGTRTFEISNSHAQEIFQNDSIEETAQYIVAFLTSYDLSTNS